MKPIRKQAGAVGRRIEEMEDRITPANLLYSLYPDPTGPQAGAQFGNSVAADTNFRVVGASFADEGGVTDAGEAFVYNAASALVATLFNPTLLTGDRFGYAVALSGNTVVVGAYGDDTGGTDSGSAYVFNATTGALIPTLLNPATASSDLFGIAVAISGNLVVVGASVDDPGGVTDAGTADVFNATFGVLISTLNNPTPGLNDQLGHSVAISGTTIVVGAVNDDTEFTGSGAAD